jgi:transposase
LTKSRKKILELEQQIVCQSNLIKELSDKVVFLEKELSFYRTKKNSSNSSMPPSQDLHKEKRTESLRQKTGLKVGGQLGHEGSFLEMVAEPTETVEHHPQYCQCCGKDLSNIASEFIAKSQVIDIPVIKPTVIEHQIYPQQQWSKNFTSFASSA